jgi:hypothetical protein
MDRLNDRVSSEVVQAYANRGKGSSDAFVDHTRNGAYLRVDPSTGTVHELSRDEYMHSSLPKHVDGKR